MKLCAAYMGDLQEAKRPGILVGGGAYKSRERIMEFAEKHRIPVFRTWNALDVATDDSPVYGGTVGTYGGPGRNFGVQNCDLLLILGCRISGRITGGMPETFARGAKTYRIDIEDGRDAGEFVDQCLTRYSDWTLKFDEWMRQCHIWVNQYDPVKPEHFAQTWHHYAVMRALSQDLPANAIVTYDTGGNAIMMGHCFQSKRGQRIFSSNGNSSMGFGMCGAIGAAFAEPSRPVFSVIGDGGLSLNIQEAQTIKHYGLPVKIILFNNHILGNTRVFQIQNKKAPIACNLEGGYSCPDFVDVFRAYGIESLRLESWDDYQKVMKYVISAPHAILLDVVHHEFCDYQPRFSLWQGGIEEMFPPLPKEEFLSNMTIPPVDGWEERRMQYRAVNERTVPV